MARDAAGKHSASPVIDVNASFTVLGPK